MANNSLSNKNNKKVSRKQKLKELNFDVNAPKDIIDDKTLDSLYQNKNSLIKKSEPKQTKKYYHITKPKCDKVDKSHIRYQTLLKFINALLVSLGKDTINEITQFQNIPKDELVKPERDKLIDQHLDNIISAFGRTIIKIRMRADIKEYMISLLRSMVTYCGYSFAIFQGKNIARFDKKQYTHESFYLYSIME